MNTVKWFEIPSSDIDRAQAFYEEIFGLSLINMDNPAIKMRVFPVEDLKNQASGAIVFHEKFYTPSKESGPLVYLNGGDDLQVVLDRVEKAGGSIMCGKTQISDDFGFMAIFYDTEGNRIGLMSKG